MFFSFFVSLYTWMDILVLHSCDRNWYKNAHVYIATDNAKLGSLNTFNLSSIYILRCMLSGPDKHHCSVLESRSANSCKPVDNSHFPFPERGFTLSLLFREGLNPQPLHFLWAVLIYVEIRQILFMMHIEVIKVVILHKDHINAGEQY